MTYNPISVYMDALRKSFDYRGKASRGEYWIFLLVVAVIIFLIEFGLSPLIYAIYGVEPDNLPYYRTESGYQVGSNVVLIDVLIRTFILSFTFALPSLSLVARRLNDIGSHWWLLVFLIPFCPFMPSFIICLPVIVLGCVPSKQICYQ